MTLLNAGGNPRSTFLYGAMHEACVKLSLLSSNGCFLINTWIYPGASGHRLNNNGFKPFLFGAADCSEIFYF